MKIRFDYFFSWFDKSGQKDAAAKFSIKQFYAFVINGVSFTLYVVRQKKSKTM